jgi:hypothetical protein
MLALGLIVFGAVMLALGFLHVIGLVVGLAIAVVCLFVAIAIARRPGSPV